MSKDKEPEKKEATPKEETKPSVTIIEDKSKLKAAEASAKPKEPEKQVVKKDATPKITLDTLSVEAVDGIGTKITEKLKPIGITTLEQLAEIKPENISLLTKIPTHRLMEYQKKAEKILELELESEMLDALAAKKYTIEQAVEEKIDVLQEIFGVSKDEVRNFLGKLVQVTMYLDAITCRSESVAILHRRKKEKEPEARKPGGVVGDTLDTLSVEAIDGIGLTITKKLNELGVNNLTDLTNVHPPAIYKAVGVPVHKLMELRKKAQMILGLELDEEIIDKLAEKEYTIEQAIEEDPIKIRDLTRKPQDEVMEFLDNVVQITMFLDAETARSNSISILHKAKKVPKPPKEEEAIEYDEIRYLGKEQILGKIFSTELDFTILKLLRERARNKSEILKILENRLMKAKLSDINNVIDLMVQTELVQMEWFEGNFDVHLFLISDFAVFRTPAVNIIEECEKNRPSPMVAEEYLRIVGEFFDSYNPTYEDNLFIAQQLRDPDIFVTLSLLRQRMYPLKKFPKGMKGEGVDMLSIIRKMEEAGIIRIIKDETKEDWVLLLTDIRAPQFYPEYMLENIRKDAFEKKVAPELATKHLDLLELHYDTFYEIYNTFFRVD